MRTANELLADLEAATNYSDYVVLVCKVEQAMNTASINGHFDEADRISAEWKRIAAANGPRLRAEAFASIRTYSPEECRAYQLARNAGLSPEAARAAMNATTQNEAA